MTILNILCFGDSLTEGYSAWGSQFTPYAHVMKTVLAAKLNPTTVTVEVDGRSGDCVDDRLGSFIYRINARCSKAAKQSTLFNWIVILGGTNDLGSGLSASTVFTSLKKVYAIALEHGAHVLAVTVPECEVEITTLDANRNELNDLIKEYNPEGFEGRFHTLDLFKLMPYHSESLERREDIWDDGLHFTSHGYSVMGNIIAQRLLGLLNPAAQSGNVQTTSSEEANGAL